jgi:hypothetical protein
MNFSVVGTVKSYSKTNFEPRENRIFQTFIKIDLKAIFPFSKKNMQTPQETTSSYAMKPEIVPYREKL